ncbi:MAG: N-6 DNA methylase [Patescibacteria group bacterium]|nr:N-6 DNA methylase [Patescibacteria group bacterium]
MKSKKLGKISKTTETRISSPFDISSHKTERSAVAILMHWMRNIIEQNSLDLGLPDVETISKDGKYPDAAVYKTRRIREILCEMEFKPPYFDPFDEKELKMPAWEKANSQKAKYFATSNFKELILWNTEKVNAQEKEERQIVQKYHLSEINDLDLIEEARFKNSIIAGLDKFLKDLYQISTGIKVEPKLAIDEFLIWRLQEIIKKLAHYYQAIIYDQAHKDSKFIKDLRKWFIDQGWSFAWQNSDFDKAARQTAYLLVNKILFYNVLQSKRSNELNPLSIPEDITKGGLLKSFLQGYFGQVLKIDYETIYTTDFIDQLAFPESQEVVEEIKKLVNLLKRYDFSTLGFDIVGRVFERLIPEDERHTLGQYFTNPDIVDLILKFCLRHEDDKILDPACGAGTFLVRAYQHKKLMNQRLSHEKILNDLWGIDIAKFPAHLATINLAINDLSVDKNYPRIIQKDFFDLLSFEDQGFQLPEDVRKIMLKTVSGKELEIIHPRWFEVIVGNPPYTRQEEISEISGEKTYKERLINKALTYGPRKTANISKRAGIYTYFFIHGTKFLKNNGRFGFIVSNAWLDVEYGTGLQEFFLKNYKIIAVIESKVERWFEDADINTCLVILEKASGLEFKKERDENLVRFVYLLKPLRHFIPPAQDIWEKQKQRLDKIDELIKTIKFHNEFYQNDELRIYPKRQSELWDEGFDIEKQKYIGSKWGKYIRAPEIFFKILEKGKDKLVPLKEIADVRFGIKTGANEFFYLTEEEIKRRKIEKEFWMHQDENGHWLPNYVIKSPRECKSIIVKPKDLKYRVLMIHKDKKELKGTNVLKYILEGERKGFHKRPTCAGREMWWALPDERHEILWWVNIGERFACFLNPSQIYADKMFYYLTLKDGSYKKVFLSIINSTLQRLIIENSGQELTGALTVVTLTVDHLKNLFFINIKKLSGNIIKKLEKCFDIISKRTIGNIFEEIGTENSQTVSLDKIKPDRRELDRIIMGEILGLTDEEQLEVYRAVVDLVKSRIEKAKSVDKKKKTKTGIDIEALINTVLEKIGENTLKKFYKEKILYRKDLILKKLPSKIDKLKIRKSTLGWVLDYKKNNFINCRSEIEARYLKIWLEVGAQSIKIPKSQKYLEKIIDDLERTKSNIDGIIKDYLDSILDQKIKNQILYQIWQRII